MYTAGIIMLIAMGKGHLNEFDFIFMIYQKCDIFIFLSFNCLNFDAFDHYIAYR